jgi:hypothetical protein
MAFVSDFNEEELNRALAALGPSNTVDSGPGAPNAAPSAPAGPAVPSSPDAAPAGGQGAGTGFVNLSRYFDANDQGAEKGANAVVQPLKQDLTEVGDKAAMAIRLPDAPSAPAPFTWDAPVDAPRDDQGNLVGPEFAQDKADREKAYNETIGADYSKALADYGVRTEQAKSEQELARKKATDAAQLANLQTGRSYLENPNNLVAAMSKGGQTPSSFDAYLTGGAMPNAYAGLSAYYGNDAASNAGRSGAGGGRQVFPGTAPPPVDAAAAMDPQQRKKSKNVGGW